MCNAQVLENIYSASIQGGVFKRSSLKGRKTCCCGHRRADLFGSNHLYAVKEIQDVPLLDKKEPPGVPTTSMLKKKWRAPTSLMEKLD